MLKALAFTRFAGAGLTVVGLVALIINGLDKSSTFTFANFFSFFTVESNTLCALVLLISGLAALRGKQTRELSGFRGAVTTYMVITGIVYNLLLAGLQEQLQTNLQWANIIVHVVMPIWMLLDFLVDRSLARLGLRNALVWLIFPILYLVYTEIRGPIVGWYPYPFMDPRPHGWLIVIAYCIGVAAAFFVIAVVIAYSSKILNQSEPKPVSPVSEQNVG